MLSPAALHHLQPVPAGAAAGEAASSPFTENLPSQLTREVTCGNLYLKMHLRFNTPVPVSVSPKLFSDVLQSALLQLHGVVGGAVPWDLLSSKPDGSAIIKVAKGDAERLWAAAAVLTIYDNTTCHLAVTQASPFLASLAQSSLSFMQQLGVTAHG